MTQQILEQAGEVTSVGFSPDGKFLISALSNGLFAIRKGKADFQLIHTFGHPSKRARSFAIHSIRQEIVFASQEVLEIWSITEAKQIKIITVLDKDEKIQALSFSPNGNLLAIATDYERVRVVDYKTGELISQFNSGERNSALFFNSESSILACAYSFPGSSKIKLHKFSNQIEIEHTQSLIHSGFDAIAGGQFSPSGKYISFTDKYLKLYNTESGSLIWAFSDENTKVNTAEESGYVENYWTPPIFLKNDRQLICGTPNGDINLYNISEGKIDKILSNHSGSVYSIALSPDEQYLLSTGADQRMIVTALRNADGTENSTKL